MTKLRIKHIKESKQSTPRRTVKFSAEDKALLRCILEEVSTDDINKYIDSINEAGDYLVGNKWSVGQTPGVTDKGIKGLAKALPSAALSFLVCPPATILRLIGAVRQSAEKRYVKSIFNPNRWLDFIATEKQKTEAKEELIKKTQYYYTRLYNGEILRVVGSSILEAKEMIMAIEHKDIIPRYENWNRALNLHIDGKTEDTVSDPSIINTKNIDNFIMWVIKFKDGEACYAFGRADATDKEDIMKAAIESRKSVVEYYRSIKYRDEDNDKKKSQSHASMDDDLLKLFKVPDIEDMIRIDNPNAYKMITNNNYKMFTEPSTSPLYWEEQGQVSYRINVKFGEFTVPLASDKEYKALLDILSTDGAGFNKVIEDNVLSEEIPDETWYRAVCPNKDWFIVIGKSQNVTNTDDETKTNVNTPQKTDINEIKKTVAAYETAIELAITQGVKNKTISEKTREQYNKIKQINSAYSSNIYVENCDRSTFSHPKIHSNRTEISNWYRDWPMETVATKIDRHTNMSVEQGIRYKDAA